MTWTIERKVTVGGLAGALLLMSSGLAGWYDVKHKAAKAEEISSGVQRDLYEHKRDHKELDQVVKDLSLGQAVLREQVHGLKSDLKELKEENRRDFDRVLRALGNNPLSVTPSDRP